MTIVSDAAPPSDTVVLAVDAPVPADVAPQRPAFATTISVAGVGPITLKTEPRKLASLFPGLVQTSKAEETEDTKYEWFTLSRNKAVVLKVLLDHMRTSKHFWRVLVMDPMFSTASGLHVGSTGADYAATYTDAVCKRKKFEDDIENTLYCEAKSGPQLVFYFDARLYPGELGAVSVADIATLPMTMITWSAPEPVDE